MTSDSDVRKQEDERTWARRLLVCIGEDPRGWELASRDRPDLIAKGPSGGVFGIEITQLLLSDDGCARAVETNLTQAIHDTVSEFIGCKGGSGGTVFGTNFALPQPGETIEPFRRELRTHLERFGSGFIVDGTEISEPLDHEWGCIESISRNDSNEDVFLYETGVRPLAHKAWKSQEELERLVIERVANKVALAREYDVTHPLWLGIRNINDVISEYSQTGKDLACAVNSGVFQRITVFHDPWDTLDARPIEPRFVDVL